MSEEIIISVEDVFLSYEKLFSSLKPEHSLPLKGISFKIYKGECLGVLGRNGAGKSTLLKLLAGILVPDKGKIVNQGHSVSLLTIQAGFAPLLTGRENAILGGIIMGKNKKTMESIVEEIKEYSGLGDFLKR